MGDSLGGIALDGLGVVSRGRDGLVVSGLGQLRCLVRLGTGWDAQDGLVQSGRLHPGP